MPYLPARASSSVPRPLCSPRWAVAVEASRRSATLTLARQRLAQGVDGADAAACRRLERVGLYGADAELFARAARIGPMPPAAAAALSSNARPASLAWHRGDWAYAAGDWVEATWYWRAGYILARQDGEAEEALLGQTTDQALTAAQRAMALFHLTACEAEEKQNLFLSDRATKRIDLVLAVDPNCLPAQLVGAAQALTAEADQIVAERLRAAIDHPIVKRACPVLADARPLADAEFSHLPAWHALAQFWPQQALLHYADGVACSARKDYPAAADAMQRASQRSPASITCCAGLAQVAQFLGDHRAAERHWARSIALDAERSHCHLALGLLQAERGAEREAEESFANYLELEDDVPTALVELGMALGGQGLWSKARDAYVRALADTRLPREARINATTNLGITCRKLGAHEEALIVLTEADALLAGCRRAPVFLHLGYTNAELGRMDSAASWLLRAVEARDEGDVRLVVEVAQKLSDLGLHGQARGVWALVPESDDSFPEALTGFAVTFFNVHEDAEALAYAQRALEIDPRQPMALFVRAEVHLRANDLEAAQRDFVAALELDPRVAPRAWHALAGLFASQGLPVEALRQIELAQTYFPDDTTLFSLLGSSLMLLGEDAKQQWVRHHPDLVRWAQLEPDSALAHHALALSHQHLDDDEGARLALATAYRLEPDNYAILTYYAAALWRVDAVEDAVRVLGEACVVEPENPTARANLQEAMRLYALTTLGFEAAPLSRTSTPTPG